jgi:hypothetical protein
VGWGAGAVGVLACLAACGSPVRLCQRDAECTVPRERCETTHGLCVLAEEDGGADGGLDGGCIPDLPCRAAAGPCDLLERCTPEGTCPPDGYLPATVMCRGDAGVCDVAERCTGLGPSCPADGFLPATAVCRDAAGVCDVAETCTGQEPSCPADAYATASTECAPQRCTGATYTPPALCAGATVAAACVPAVDRSCGGYLCLGSACRTSCAGDGDCAGTFYCGGAACQAKKADGQPCGGASECLGGLCARSYADADGDGYGAGAAQGTCGAVPPGRSSLGTDCCDLDDRAYPGAASARSTARVGCGGFDFDCDGLETPELTTVGVGPLCVTHGTCLGNDATCTADGLEGWAGATAPACGQPGSFITCLSLTCTVGGASSCNASPVTAVQSCR